MPRKHCLFSHNGTPTTQPGTADDALRINLSQLLTAILVRHGDEQPGDYQTPGANGYNVTQPFPTLDERPTPTNPDAHVDPARSASNSDGKLGRRAKSSGTPKKVGKRLCRPVVSRHEASQVADTQARLWKLLDEINAVRDMLTKLSSPTHER